MWNRRKANAPAFTSDIKGFDKKAKLKGPVKHSINFASIPKVADVEGPSTAERASETKPRDEDRLSHEMLLQRIRARRVIPFIGAGMSMPLLPSWWELLKMVAERVGLEVDPKESLTILTEQLREVIRKQRTLAMRNPTQTQEKEEEPQRKQKKQKKNQSLQDKKQQTQHHEEPEEKQENLLSPSGRHPGLASLERQKSVAVPTDLADQFEAIFRDHIERKADPDERVVNAFLRGTRLPYRKLDATVKEAMKAPVAVMSGHWPLIMTTNWDCFLEMAFGMFGATGIPPLDIWDENHPSERHFYRRTHEAVVRYRANVQEVFAELRAGVNPPRLLKLHGDFTEKGRPEMVAGHADYRRLMCHGVAFTRLMQYISSNYSLLFYGCSLTDPDLLATLDGMVESLGGEVGPHFWLTADRVSSARADFLRRHYSIFTIRTREPFLFGELSDLLIDICNKGWSLPKPLQFSSVAFNAASWLPDGPGYRIVVENATPEDILKRMSGTGTPAAAAISCGCSNWGAMTYGNQAMKMLGDRLRNRSRIFKVQFYPKRDKLWRAVPFRDEDLDMWMVCGQDVGGGGSLGSLFDSVQHFVQRATTRLYSGIRDPPDESRRDFHSKPPKSYAEYQRYAIDKQVGLSSVPEETREAPPADLSKTTSGGPASGSKASESTKGDKPTASSSTESTEGTKKASGGSILYKVMDFVLGPDPSDDEEGSVTSPEPPAGGAEAKTAAAANVKPEARTSSAQASAEKKPDDPNTTSVPAKGGSTVVDGSSADCNTATLRIGDAAAPAKTTSTDTQLPPPAPAPELEKSPAAKRSTEDDKTGSRAGKPTSAVTLSTGEDGGESPAAKRSTEDDKTESGVGKPAAAVTSSTGEDGEASSSSSKPDMKGARDNASKTAGGPRPPPLPIPGQSLLSAAPAEGTSSKASSASPTDTAAVSTTSKTLPQPAKPSSAGKKAETPREASSSEAAGSSGEDQGSASPPSPSPPSRVVLCLPLISAGGGMLHSHEVLSATISAIGDLCMKYVPPCEVDIYICMATPDVYARGGRVALMSDIQGGRMVIGDILSRSICNHMEFTCVTPLETCGSSTEADSDHWQCRKVVMPLTATLRDLRAEMNYIVDDQERCDANIQDSLLALNITDGSIVKLDANGCVTR